MSKKFNIPSGYNDNKIVLMTRDPATIFAYWEIRKEVEDAKKEEIKRRGLTVQKSVLRVYDVTENDPDTNPRIVYDFELKNWTNNWYIHTERPGREWMVDVGLVCTTGEFFTLARSNRVKTPMDKMSDMTDEALRRLKGMLASGESSSKIATKNTSPLKRQ